MIHIHKVISSCFPFCLDICIKPQCVWHQVSSIYGYSYLYNITHNRRQKWKRITQHKKRVDCCPNCMHPWLELQLRGVSQSFISILFCQKHFSSFKSNTTHRSLNNGRLRVVYGIYHSSLRHLIPWLIVHLWNKYFGISFNVVTSDIQTDCQTYLWPFYCLIHPSQLQLFSL